MQTTVHFATQQTRNNYVKTMTRLERAIATGRFLALSLRKRRQLWQRLLRYSRQLGRAIKPSLAAAMLTMGVFMTAPVNAQTVVQRTGVDNPLNGKSVPGESKPAFADLDGDADVDMMVGQSYANNVYFIRTSGAPVTFGAGSQFSFEVLENASPTFFDYDNDGDMDLFTGTFNGAIAMNPYVGGVAGTTCNPKNSSLSAYSYYSTPTCTITGHTNPLAGITVGNNATPAFVDIDNDGDMDLFIGNSLGVITYYKNTGTLGSPVFSLQSGASNPFNGVDVGNYAAPAFADIDGDGDKDALIGAGDGTLKYYKNTGTAAAPVFTLQSGAADIFSTIDVGNNAAPTFTDLDGDTDRDLVLGDQNGNLYYYEITGVLLPVVWKEFSVQQQGSAVRLQWATQQEQQTKDFVVQHSTDGTNWTNIATVKSAGNSLTAKQYQYLHATAAAGINYYRLLQRDLDNTTATSVVRNIRLQGALAGFAASVQGNQLLLQVREPMELSLLNAQGVILRKGRFATGYQQLDLSQYPAGVYFVHGKGHSTRIVRQ
ncbi:MAG: FG-GAP-like repeat-containing protein [Bacteroidetes bacterium]|uniref:FG-GAP-like repeat-containing protein n=1 Tax=Phnomibacter sp. TaxID=2836217 RepID=UPI002FDD521A|nr:FG-GAP-like repeat-containing protein [Bacteroidota bacterium]